MLTGKIALVTGAAKGIGKACAIELAKHGAKVIGADLEIDNDLFVDDLNAVGKHGHRGLYLDVKDSGQIEKFVDALGDIDILVNNAGILRPGASGIRLSEDEWDLVQTNNHKSVFLLSKKVLPFMMK